MKKYIPILLISTITLSLGAGRASAGDDEALYALGGFIGGVLTTKALDHRSHNHTHNRVVYTESCRYEKKQYKHGHHKHSCDRGCDHYAKPSGYYKTVKVRVWVPGHWESYRDRCGTRVREWQRGHYTYEKKRVWVESDRRGHHGYAYSRR